MDGAGPAGALREPAAVDAPWGWRSPAAGNMEVPAVNLKVCTCARRRRGGRTEKRAPAGRGVSRAAVRAFRAREGGPGLGASGKGALGEERAVAGMNVHWGASGRDTSLGTSRPLQGAN